MNLKTFLVLSGVLNLVLLTNFVPSLNQTLDDQTQTQSDPEGAVESADHIPPKSAAAFGLTARQAQLLFLAEKKHEQEQAWPH